jgi:hypothetical protein
MNQPNGRCHASLHPAVLKAQRTLTEQYSLREGTPDPLPNDILDVPMEYSEDGDFGDTDFALSGFNDSGFANEDSGDVNMEREGDVGQPMEAKPLEEGVADYYEGASKTFGRGMTFMDHFHNDKYTKERVANVYFPFCSAEEWQLASFISRSNLSVPMIDELINLRLVSYFTPSKRQANILNRRQKCIFRSKR